MHRDRPEAGGDPPRPGMTYGRHPIEAPPLGHPTQAVGDLMQPLDPSGKPRVHEPALNHIGLWVDDLPQAVAWLTQQGVRFTPGGIRKGASGHDVCFIHPKAGDGREHSGQGVLIELVQAPAELAAAYAAAQKP